MQSEWLDKVAYGVYKVAGANVSLWGAVSAYNSQLGKECIVGAETALELYGFAHYVPMGKPLAFLYTSSLHPLPSWFLNYEWDRILQYQTSSFLDKDGLQEIGYEIVCEPELNLLAFNHPNIKPRDFAEKLEKLGWNVSVAKCPIEAIRVVLMNHIKKRHIKELLEDLKEIY